MAAAEVLEVIVRGHGGHASQPHRAADPIAVACEIVTALQTMVTRRFDVFDPVIITVGSFHAGTTDNVIPDQAHFLATVRSFSPGARERVRAAAVTLIGDIAAAHAEAPEALDLDADESQIEFPIVYCNARAGRAGLDPDELADDLGLRSELDSIRTPTTEGVR